jgi:predicted branched-subunit amino acid permease
MTGFLTPTIFFRMTLPAQQQAFREGLRAGMPSWFGVAAWGLVVGVAMIKTSLTLWQSLGMTLLVFAGSAQLAALPLIAAGAPVWVIFATALVVNLRFVIFSALLAPHFSGLPWRTRAWLGFLTGDVTVAIFMQRFPDLTPDARKLPYLKGLIYPNWSSWQVGSILGILLGSQIPTSWGLDFAGTLAILCITLPLLMNHATLFGAVVAAIVALLAAHMPYKLGLLLAVIVGMSASMLLASWKESRLKDKS